MSIERHVTLETELGTAVKNHRSRLLRNMIQTKNYNIDIGSRSKDYVEIISRHFPTMKV